MRCPTRLPFLPVFQQTWNRFFGIYMPPLKGCWRKFRSQIGYYVAWPYIHLTLYRPSLGYLEVLRYHTCPILMVRALLLPSALSLHFSFHQGHKPPSSIVHPSTKHATCFFDFCDNFVVPLMFLVSRVPTTVLTNETTPRTTLILSFPHFSLSHRSRTRLRRSLSFRLFVSSHSWILLLAASTAPPPRQAVFNPYDIPVSPPPGNVRPQPHRQPELLWLQWMICLAAWTTEALCTHPIMSQAVPPDEYFETFSARNIYIQMRRAIHEFNILQRRIARGISLLQFVVSSSDSSPIHGQYRVNPNGFLRALGTSEDNYNLGTTADEALLSRRQPHRNFDPSTPPESPPTPATPDTPPPTTIHRHLHALAPAHLPRSTFSHRSQVHLPLPHGLPPRFHHRTLSFFAFRPFRHISSPVLNW